MYYRIVALSNGLVKLYRNGIVNGVALYQVLIQEYDGVTSKLLIFDTSPNSKLFNQGPT